MAELHPHTEPHPDVAGYLLGTLDSADARAFAEHLPRCQACQDELAELAALPGLLAKAAPAEVLPADLEARTFAAIEAAATEAGPFEFGATESVVTSVPEARPPAPVVPIQRARERRGRRPGRVIMAAVAAVVAVAVGVGVLSSIGKSPQAPVATIQLISATGGPAHGTATIRISPAGLTVDMRVDGLAPNPPGTIYTCWLVGPGDTLAHQNRVSVGSFVVRSNQVVHVHWTTAADLRQFPHLGITLEPDNGNPRHQGAKVLAGP